MNDNEIISLIRSRDESGAENLLKHYSPLINYVISPILTNNEDQAECLNEVIMRIWNKIDLFDEERGSFKSFVTAIARNCALNRIRRSTSDNLCQLTDSVPSPHSSPEEMLLKKEAQQKLLSALNNLSHSDKALFYRKYYYMQSTMQIAAETALSPRAVEGRLYRIKKRLRKMLGGDFND